MRVQDAFVNTWRWSLTRGGRLYYLYSFVAIVAGLTCMRLTGSLFAGACAGALIDTFFARPRTAPGSLQRIACDALHSALYQEQGSVIQGRRASYDTLVAYTRPLFSLVDYLVGLWLLVLFGRLLASLTGQ